MKRMTAVVKVIRQTTAEKKDRSALVRLNENKARALLRQTQRDSKRQEQVFVVFKEP